MTIDGVPVGELHYGVARQPWFVGTLVQLPGYSRYSEILSNLEWNPADDADVERILRARNAFEELRVQLIYRDGVSKTLNRTMFHILSDASFGHRMCAEDLLVCRRGDIFDTMTGRRPFHHVFGCVSRYVRLRLELAVDGIRRSHWF